MASLEILALDTVTPQIRAPAAGDTYAVTRNVIFSAGTLGIYANVLFGTGFQFDTGNGRAVIWANNVSVANLWGTAIPGVDVLARIGFCADPGAGNGDCGFARVSGRHIKVTDGSNGGHGVLSFTPTTVGGLPTGVTGMRATVNDSTVVAAGNFGNAVVGGGANTVPIYHDGTNWKIG